MHAAVRYRNSMDCVYDLLFGCGVLGVSGGVLIRSAYMYQLPAWGGGGSGAKERVMFCADKNMGFWVLDRKSSFYGMLYPCSITCSPTTYTAPVEKT